MTINNNFIYRFRSCGSLFKHNELENQEIYFSDFKSLNDPNEELLNIVFEGDSICWENLFKNYIRSLYMSIMYNLSYQTKEIEVVIYQDYDFYKKEENKKYFNGVADKLLENKKIKLLICFLGKHRKDITIKKNNVIYILTLFHDISLDIVSRFIIENYSGMNLIVDEICSRWCSYPDNKKLSNILDSLFFTRSYYKMELNFNKSKEQVKEEYKSKYKSNMDFSFQLITSIGDKNMQAIRLYNNSKCDPIFKEKYYLLYFQFDFPRCFIKKIQELMYPDFYISCFTDNANNSAMWGHYADKHEGVCLIFKTKNDSLMFNSPSVYTSNGIEYENLPHKFYKVNYKNEFQRFNFFSNIKYIPLALIHIWIYDVKNRKNSSYGINYEQSDEKRKEYWDLIYDKINTKTTDWQYENEYRLISYHMPNRILRYNFEELRGIIFGINMTEENKQKIINIVNKKIKETNRNDFTFYQAFANTDTGKIEYNELLKII